MLGFNNYSSNPNNKNVSISIKKDINPTSSDYNIKLQFGYQHFVAEQKTFDKQLFVNTALDVGVALPFGVIPAAGFAGHNLIEGCIAWFGGKIAPRGTTLVNGAQYITGLPAPVAHTYSILEGAKRIGADGIILNPYNGGIGVTYVKNGVNDIRLNGNEVTFNTDEPNAGWFTEKMLDLSKIAAVGASREFLNQRKIIRGNVTGGETAGPAAPIKAISGGTTGGDSGIGGGGK